MAKSDQKEAMKRIAEKRVPKAVKAIRLIGNLARYKPSPAQTAAIVGALREALKNVEGQFAGRTETSESFRLP